MRPWKKSYQIKGKIWIDHRRGIGGLAWWCRGAECWTGAPQDIDVCARPRTGKMQRTCAQMHQGAIARAGAQAPSLHGVGLGGHQRRAECLVPEDPLQLQIPPSTTRLVASRVGWGALRRWLSHWAGPSASPLCASGLILTLSLPRRSFLQCVHKLLDHGLVFRDGQLLRLCETTITNLSTLSVVPSILRHCCTQSLEIVEIARFRAANCSVDLYAWSRSSPDNSLQEGASNLWKGLCLANLILSSLMRANLDESATLKEMLFS